MPQIRSPETIHKLSSQSPDWVLTFNRYTKTKVQMQTLNQKFCKWPFAIISKTKPSHPGSRFSDIVKEKGKFVVIKVGIKTS